MGAVANAFRYPAAASSSSLPSDRHSPTCCKLNVRRAGALNCRLLTSGKGWEVRVHCGSKRRLPRGRNGTARAPAVTALSSPRNSVGGVGEGDEDTRMRRIIPDRFVWPVGSRPDPVHDACEIEVPVLDLSVLHKLMELQDQETQLALLEDKSEAVIAKEAAIKRQISRHQHVRKQLLNEVQKALLQLGFFQIVNHGFPNDLLYNLSSTAHRFFERSDEEKGRAVLSPSGDSHGFGYKGPWTSREGNWIAKAEVWQETLMLGCPGTTSDSSPDMIDCLAPLIADPGHGPWVNSLIKRYTTTAEGVAVTVLGLIAESLGLPPSYFAHHLLNDDTPMRLLRLNYGSRCPNPELTWGSRPHTDPVAVTLLHQDLVGGLQFRTRAGQWVGVRPIPDAFIVSAGDLLQAWTNDHVISAQHRVVTNKEQARLSMAVFYIPPAETVIVPAPELVDENNPVAYRRFTVAEFAAATQTRWTEDGNALLNQFRIPPQP